MPEKTRSERIRERSKERREREKEETKEAILLAAGDEFLENGYDKFSLRRVAERAGYAPSTIYLYFDNKDDLVFTICDVGFQRFVEGFQRAMAVEEPTRDKLFRIGQNYLDFAIKNPVHYQMMFMQRTDYLIGAHPQDDQDVIKLQSLGVLQQVVAQAMEEGILPIGDVEAVSNALWGLVHGLAALAIQMSKMFEVDHAYAALESAMNLMVPLKED